MPRSRKKSQMVSDRLKALRHRLFISDLQGVDDLAAACRAISTEIGFNAIRVEWVALDVCETPVLCAAVVHTRLEQILFALSFVLPDMFDAVREKLNDEFFFELELSGREPIEQVTYDDDPESIGYDLAISGPNLLLERSGPWTASPVKLSGDPNLNEAVAIFSRLLEQFAPNQPLQITTATIPTLPEDVEGATMLMVAVEATSGLNPSMQLVVTNQDAEDIEHLRNYIEYLMLANSRVTEFTDLDEREPELLERLDLVHAMLLRHANEEHALEGNRLAALAAAAGEGTHKPPHTTH